MKGDRMVRGVAVAVAVVAPTPWLWGVAAEVGRRAALGVPLRPAEALTGLVAGAALAVLLVLALAVLLELMSRVPGVVGGSARRVGGVVLPRLVRHVAGVALGAAMTAGATPAMATATPAATTAFVVLAPTPPPDPSFAPLPDPGWAPPGTSSATAGAGWVPSAPVVRTQPDVRVLSPAPRAGTRRDDAPPEVVVRRGDSLWAIAARHLGPDASDAEIARAWPAWFQANRNTVGDDPDVLRPGQLLRVPDVVPS